MMASVGNSIAAERTEKNYTDMRRFDFIYTAIAGWATGCLLCLYQPFTTVWLGSKMIFGSSVVVAMCAYFYILKSGDIRWVYHEGAGLWYECRYIMIGEAVANIVLNILLCKIWGVFGIILATVISVFVTNFFLCPRVLFKNYFKDMDIKEYWLDHILYACTMLITAGISWFACEGVLPIEMVSRKEIVSCILCLGGRLIICTSIAVLIFWFVWHRSERYKSAVAWMKKMVKA